MFSFPAGSHLRNEILVQRLSVEYVSSVMQLPTWKCKVMGDIW